MEQGERIAKRVWITKYALTEGIIEATDVEVSDEKYVRARYGKHGDRCLFLAKAHWTESEAEAQTRYQEMLAAKIKSLNKQLKALGAKVGQKASIRSITEIYS